MFKTDPSTLTSGQVMSWSSSEEYIGDESSVQSMSKSQTASQSPDKTTDQCELLVKSESPPQLSLEKSESPLLLSLEDQTVLAESKSHSPTPESKDTKKKDPFTPEPIAKSKKKELPPIGSSLRKQKMPPKQLPIIAFDNWYYPGRHDIKTELLDEHFIKITKASKTNSASKAVEFFTLFQDILVDDETYIALGFGDDNEEIDDDGINPTDFNVLDENWSDLDDEVKEEIEEKCIDENDSMDQEDEDIDLDLSEMIQNDYGLSNNSLVHGK
eukprot:116396_1